MIKQVNKYCRNAIIMSALLSVVAILLIINPIKSLTIITTFLGAILIGIGILQVISYARADKEIKAFSFSLILGLITLIAGFIFVLNPTSIYNFIITIAGIWIIIESIIRLQLTVSFNKKSTYSIIMAIITLVLGIIMLVNPFAAIEAVGMVAGISLLVNEIVNILGIITIMKSNKETMIK